MTSSPGLIPPEREYHQPRYLTEREYKALLDACRHETRDAAIIELLLQTGMRLCELAGLKLTDVQLPARISKEPEGAGCVRILGKGRRERTVTLNWKACKAVRAYLTVRPKDAPDQHLFLTKFRLGISARSIERLVEKHLREAGIHDASVHTLRHTFGTTLGQAANTAQSRPRGSRARESGHYDDLREPGPGRHGPPAPRTRVIRVEASPTAVNADHRASQLGFAQPDAYLRI